MPHQMTRKFHTDLIALATKHGVRDLVFAYHCPDSNADVCNFRGSTFWARGAMQQLDTVLDDYLNEDEEEEEAETPEDGDEWKYEDRS